MTATLPDMAPPASGDGHNVTDWCLEQFHERYGDESITKDDIWEYLYGVMHAPDWRERYRHDLARNLPRVPLAEDFEAFRSAGRALMDLHVGYETCPECPSVECLVDDQPDEGGADPGAYRITGRMQGRNSDGSRCGKNDDWDVLAVNDRCRLVGIPPEAHAYKVSGRSPLQWAVDQLKFKARQGFGHHRRPQRLARLGRRPLRADPPPAPPSPRRRRNPPHSLHPPPIPHVVTTAAAVDSSGRPRRLVLHEMYVGLDLVYALLE